MEQKKTVVCCRFASKLRIQRARLIWTMYSFLFISGGKKTTNKQGLARGPSRHAQLFPPGPGTGGFLRV